MNEAEIVRLRSVAAEEALASARSLAAAERAVEEGRLNIAKILRAGALASRQRALALARYADAGLASADAVGTAEAAARDAIGALDDLEGGRGLLDTIARSAASSIAIVMAAREALVATRDVPEAIVAQLLFVCEECGFTMQGSRAEVCPSCGSIAGEFALFAPFFSGTAEHIARRKPDEALTQLRGDGARIAAALVGDDARLRLRPADGEWCAKEIAGHMIDIVELATRRLRALVDSEYTPPAERTILPWKLLEDEDYPDVPANEIAARFGTSLSVLIALFEGMAPDTWRKKADLVSGRTLVVDVASWVANHNVAHLRQVEALLGREQTR